MSKSSRFLLLFLIILATFIITVIIKQPSQPSQPSQPALSVETLFAASDVRAGLKEAFEHHDENAFMHWQEQLLTAALQVGYKEEQLRFLSGDRGLEYIKFRAARMLFQEAIEKAYVSGDAFEPIAARYPQAEDLFADVQAMFTARNQTLDGIATALLQAAKDDPSLGSLTLQQAQQHALELWQQKLTQAATESE
ncbi:hypothetical protein [Alteromonas flava]|uniref:hypothetical protein n=1 Tax=Alteromonas flava TaxID=2048003 RepID=UPI000C28D3C7|nr:hypothetical protein [Alteromonas flava]